MGIFNNPLLPTSQPAFKLIQKQTARLTPRGSYYHGSAGRRVKKIQTPLRPERSIPSTIPSLRKQTTNRVVNYRIGKSPVSLDTLLSKLI